MLSFSSVDIVVSEISSCDGLIPINLHELAFVGGGAGVDTIG